MIHIRDSLAVLLDHSAGNAHDRGIRRNVFENDASCANLAMLAYANGAEHLCACRHHNALFERGVTLARILARTAEGYALIKHAVVADLGGFANDEAYAVVYENSAADIRRRVNVYARLFLCSKGYVKGKRLHSLFPELVRITISTQGFIPCVRSPYDSAARGGRIFLHYNLQIALFCLGNFHCDSFCPLSFRSNPSCYCSTSRRSRFVRA